MEETDLHWTLLNTSHTRVLVDRQEHAKALLVRNDCGWTLYLVINGRAETTKHRCLQDYEPLLTVGLEMVQCREQKERDALNNKASPTSANRNGE